MPILAGGPLVAPDIPDIVTGPTEAYREDIGTLTATWIDSDGVEWPLTNTGDEPGWFTLMGPAGWGATPVELVTDPLPRGGEQTRFIRNKPRRIQWPMYIWGETHMQFVERYRRFLRIITKTSQRRKPGWLRITRPNGRYRQIACYYEAGLEGESGQNQSFAKPVITFFCEDGFWAGDRPITVTAQFSATDPDGDGGDGGGPTPDGATFFAPFITITSSKVIGPTLPGGDPEEGGNAAAEGNGVDEPNTIIVNAGDVDAWPTWVIRGPMVKLTAQNLTVGSKFALTHTLEAGQTITITTNRPTVRGPGDQDLSGKIDWFDPFGAELWPLADGTNQIHFQLDGAGPGTQVQMVFTPRYQTA